MKKTFLFISLICIKLNAQTIETVAGNGSCCGGIDGIPATSSEIYYPNGVIVDGVGNIFISESNKIRKVNTSGIITTYAGSLGGYSGDGGPATSALLQSSAVAVDAIGNVYSADWFHHVVRKINTSGIITTIVGDGSGGYSGDGGLAINATIASPYGVAVDAAGNIYISEGGNSRVRKINTSGIITTVAGNGTSGYSGDGGLATSAQLNNPINIALDASNNLYIADWQNHCIRKVSASGIITTVAGTGTNGYSGDGGLATLAELNAPSGVACDNFGNLFIGDAANLRVRMVNSSGIITTLAGTGIWGFSGDGGPAINAQFSQPWSIATDIFGNLYIADKDNQRIRKITNITSIEEESYSIQNIQLFPNPSYQSSTLLFNLKNAEQIKISLFDVTGKEILKIADEEMQNGNQKITINTSKLSAGIYICKIQSESGERLVKLVVGGK